MGLKPQRRTLSGLPTLHALQSNHYGIETILCRICGREIVGCNRTIMGLKPRRAIQKGRKSKKLQSNHHGIEIRFFSLFLLLYLWAHPSPQEGVCPYLVGTITQSPNGNGYKVIRLQDFERVFSKTYSAERRKSRYGVLDAGLFGQKPTL